jgi:hypothetical protein
LKPKERDREIEIAKMSSTPPSNNDDGMSQRFRNIFTPKRIRVLKKIGAGAVVTSIPIMVWWKWSIDQRKKRAEDVQTRVRVPNVQTIDDLMIERCRPGDVLLFDRRWENCAAGPLSALVCALGRSFLCFDDNNKTMTEGKFDHCGRFSFKSSQIFIFATINFENGV